MYHRRPASISEILLRTRRKAFIVMSRGGSDDSEGWKGRGVPPGVARACRAAPIRAEWKRAGQKSPARASGSMAVPLHHSTGNYLHLTPESPAPRK
ncbi:hypothetical protein CEXT_351351 [Caerostris extrusa]|uniref:Uncharacterized protein n=1 Tax=Caerostris extrusa TaxID=172846 RepID=A0AAV4RIL8_CAEEX|nr:hypothetical protein CEXT_351351 [Caerostris extrusa]